MTPPPPAITKIHDLQGAGSESPITGRTVTTEGVVTGIDDEIGASFGDNNTIRRFPEDAGIFVQEETRPAGRDPLARSEEVGAEGEKMGQVAPDAGRHPRPALVS